MFLNRSGEYARNAQNLHSQRTRFVFGVPDRATVIASAGGNPQAGSHDSNEYQQPDSVFFYTGTMPLAEVDSKLSARSN